MSEPNIVRLVLLEASKVRGYHTTLMEGIVRAYTAGGLAGYRGRPRLKAHPSFYNELSPEVREAVDFESIPVIDQEDRRLIVKSLVEVWVVARSLLQLQRSEVLLVTTIMPSAMLIVEMLKWFLPRKRLVVMMHGELASAFAGQGRGIRSFAWYVSLWLRIRSVRSDVGVAVPDFFIEREVRRVLSSSIRPYQLYVIPLPMTAIEDADSEARDRYRCCFVGFRTRNKGFEIFERLATQLHDLDFYAIGAGVDYHLASGANTALPSLSHYFRAIRRCDFGIFPYTSSYGFTLSAAAVDAVSCGLHIIAFNRPCFVALEEAFGPEAVTICDNEAELLRLLQDADWLSAKAESRPERLGRIASSPYGPERVAIALEEMMVRVSGSDARSARAGKK